MKLENTFMILIDKEGQKKDIFGRTVVSFSLNIEI